MALMDGKPPTIVRTDYGIEWLPKPNEAHYVLDDKLPPLELVTTSFVFAFEGNRFLMTRQPRRGWDIPGGHIEYGETPMETARREVYEETCAALGDMGLLGYQKIVIRACRPEGYRYPYPVGYQVFYWGRVASMDPFTETEESLERGLFSPQEARTIGWVKQYPELYEAALAVIEQCNTQTGDVSLKVV
ncbi:MAG: NUDIX domain-containing protein [Anaerolineae bacterium]|nr:NUDIX domain-containing protein [Anaerolineae bacterium]